ncbi:MAG TPA: hypothetical protein VGS79_25170 [Puia sp.]|nr:hypothetical protein [Puia sp.]
MKDTFPLIGSTIFSFFLFVSKPGWAQDFDSTFWAKHPFRQPDSTLVKDSFWFPYDPVARNYIYSLWKGHQPWAGPRDQSYGNFGNWHSAIITLRADHSFVFDAGFEGGSSLTVGRWWKISDSAICLDWNDTLSLRLCRDRKFDTQYLHRHLRDYDYPWPERIDHWAFVRRKDDLVPLLPQQ